MSKVSGKSAQRAKKGHRKFASALVGVIVVAIIAVSVGLIYSSQNKTSTQPQINSSKPIILFVDQGNGLVNQSNFSSFLTFAKSNNFNTIFFQIYRSGELLFTQSQLAYFVTNAHSENLSIFFALFLTNASQQIPVSIYGLGEDGISLDMSSLTSIEQSNLFTALQQSYNGKTAITTTDFSTTLRPDLMIFETYSSTDKQYIHPGIIAGVEPLAISTKQAYESQFAYALSHSDGVMVFDYYGLLKTGY